MDESGDLGFGVRSSKVFVIGYVASKNPLDLSRALKNIRRKKLKKSLGDVPEFKFYKASDRVKELVFDKVDVLDLQCGFVALNKERVYDALRSKPLFLYNYLIRQLLDDAVTIAGDSERINLVLDRAYNRKQLQLSLDEYLTRMASFRCDSEICISHADSCGFAGLQFADFVAGAVYSKYSGRSSKFFDRLCFTTKKELFF